MDGLAQIGQVVWGLSFAGRFLLAALLVVRKNYRVYPAFFFYVCLNLAQGVFLFYIYQQWGFSSAATWPIVWSAQAVTILARGLAVAEIFRYSFSRFTGIWIHAWRFLFGASLLMFLFSLLAIRHGSFSIVTTIQLGLDLAITVAGVGLLVVGKYYQVVMDRHLRLLAIGFCLYSSISVLNNTVWQRLLSQYDQFWNLSRMLAYLASLLIWMWALRKPVQRSAQKEVLLPVSVYMSLSPEVTARLQQLNSSLKNYYGTQP